MGDDLCSGGQPDLGGCGRVADDGDQRTGLLDDTVDGLLVDPEEGRKGPLCRGKPLVEQGDGDAVGQSEGGLAAGPRSCLPGMAAALLEGRFPLGVPCHGQLCDQLFPGRVWEPGQGRMVQPRVVRGPRGCARLLNGVFGCGRVHGVVPVAVPVMVGDGKGLHLLVADGDSKGIVAGVEFGVHA